MSKINKSLKNFFINAPSYRTHHKYVLMIILMLSIVGQGASDLYLPSLPAITHALNSPKQIIQLTIAVYLFGFSLSQLIYGPLSDQIGRRKVILIGLVICTIGSVICALANSALILIIGRFIQGTGIGGSVALTRAMMRDVYRGNRLSRVGSQLSTISSFTLAMAPTLGGYLQSWFDWRANFIFLLIYCGTAWVIVWRLLPETNKSFNPLATQLRTLTVNYFLLLSNRQFMGSVLCSSFALSGVIAYATASPFLFQVTLHFSPVEYGCLAIFIAAGLSIGAFVNSKLVMRLGMRMMLLIGGNLMVFAGILMASFYMLGHVNVYVILIPVILFIIGAGFIYSNAFAIAFTPFAHMAGIAGALYGAIQVMVAAITSSLMSMLHEHNQLPLSIIFLFLGALTMWMLDFVIKWNN